MVKVARTLAVAVVACVCASAGAAELEVAGKLLVDLHAELMVAVNEQGNAVNWYNCGSLWGTFGDFGFDGPAGNYPTLKEAGGVNAVVFDGDDRLRMDSPAPESMTSDGGFSVEVWARNPRVKDSECLVSWTGGKGGPGFAFTCGDAGGKWPLGGKWHHLVLIQAGGVRKVYVDGKPLGPPGGLTASRKVKVNIAAGGKILLGVDGAGKNHFSGAIAAVRIHDKAMTEAQVAHNHKGGVGLGAELLPNIVAKPRGILFADNSKQANIACRTSKHFRSCWEKDKDTNGVVAKRVPAQLAKAERFYEFYTKKLGMHLPIVSDKIENRGDGKKYKIEICNNWSGGNFGGHMTHGFGYPIQGPGYINPHELAHACQMHSMGSFPGNWWEAHANWMPERGGHPHVHPELNNLTSMFFMGVGRHYYHCWLIFEHLAATDEYGPLFVAKMWHNCKRGEYLWNTAKRIDPDPSTPLADEFVKMARRNITWDYPSHDRYVTCNKNPEMARLGRTLLEPMALQPGWYRVPREMAPQQLGYNICPLKPTARTVTVDLKGYVNPQRGSDWRCCLVAVNAKGKSRYGPIWGQGKGSIALKGDERELYLVVTAVPAKLMNISIFSGSSETGDYRSLAQHQFPYRVSLKGAEPLDPMAPVKPAGRGRRHKNGGGFVAAGATVDKTAYVGPGARVLGRAKVLGRARVEDFAVVKDSAVVRDHAIVSGHARVDGNAVVRDHAKVRGFARAGGRAMIRDFAKLLEHGTMTAGGKEISGHAVVKGVAHIRGNITGTAILDGSYSKSNEITRGVWFTWNWGGGKNRGELDREFGGLYAEHAFETAHPYLAWDTYGATHGYLAGAPQIVGTGQAKPDAAAKDKSRVGAKALKLNGKDQYVELQPDLADMHDFTADVTVKWAGGTRRQRIFEFAADKDTCMYLTPAGADGRLKFGIRKGGKEQALHAKTALPAGKWVNVQVMLSEDTGRLYVDGDLVDKNMKMTLNPQDIRAKVGLLGRGLAGNHFAGLIDRISIYSNALVDEVPPSPNPAAFSMPPTLVHSAEAVMQAAVGKDPRGAVEYFFEETTGHAGGDDSAWQKTRVYRDEGLKPGMYTYRVKMRDISGNETKFSKPVTVRWANPAAFVQDASDAGLIVMEAEHFHRKAAGTSRCEWKLDKSRKGYSGKGAMAAGPDIGANINAGYSGASPRLDYIVKFKKKGSYWLWVRGYGSNPNGDSVHAGIDLKEESWGGHIYTNRGGYKWMRAKAPFQLAGGGVHTISIWMREDGVMVDKILLTSDAKYKPSDKIDAFNVPVGPGPAQSPRR